MRGLVFSSLVVGLLAASSAAFAVDVRPAADSSPAQTQDVPGLSLWSVPPMTPPDLTPGLGSPGFGALGAGLAVSVSPNAFSGAAPLAPADFAADYVTNLYGSEVGLFGGYNGQPTVFENAPTAGWNLGASVGYAGFYVRAGISDSNNAQYTTLNTDAHQGRLAGLGFRTGELNLHLTYMTAQGNNLDGTEEDSRTWMIGGIYQLSPRIRLNADAFTSGHAVGSVPAMNAATPQGSGARLGLQLRF
jgi:predicted porin